MKKYLIQMTIGLCLYLLIPLVSSIPNTAEIIKYSVGAIPVLYSLALYTYYRPKNYLKFLLFNSRNKDVGYVYKISVKDYEMTLEDFESIKDIIFNLGKSNLFKPKMYLHDCGKFKFKAIFNNGFFNIDMDYSKDSEIFIFECESNSTFKKLIRHLFLINAKLLQKLNSANYDIKMYFEFLNESDNNEARNPFVSNIFREFNHRDLCLRYIAKNGTKIEILNNKISFQSDNLYGINNDIVKEITLLKKL